MKSQLQKNQNLGRLKKLWKQQKTSQSKERKKIIRKLKREFSSDESENLSLRDSDSDIYFLDLVLEERKEKKMFSYGQKPLCAYHCPSNIILLNLTNTSQH